MYIPTRPPALRQANLELIVYLVSKKNQPKNHFFVPLSPQADSLSVRYRNKLLSEQQDHQDSFPPNPCLKTDLPQDFRISEAGTHTAATPWQH